MTIEELARAFGVPAELLQDFETGRADLRDAENYRPILDKLEKERLPQHDH